MDNIAISPKSALNLKMGDRQKQLREFWERNSENWAQALDSKAIASRSATNRALLAEIATLEPKSLLDAGCGEGWLTATMTQQGTFCVGIDASEPLIKIAKDRHPECHFKPIPFSMIEQGDWHPDFLFDVIVFNFSLFEENLTPLLRALHDLLTFEGHVVIQTLPPSTLKNKSKSGWQVETFAGMTTSFSGEMPWFGRSIKDWEQLFYDSGFEWLRTSEPKLNGTEVSLLFTLRKLETLVSPRKSSS